MSAASELGAFLLALKLPAHLAAQLHAKIQAALAEADTGSAAQQELSRLQTDMETVGALGKQAVECARRRAEVAEASAGRLRAGLTAARASYHHEMHVMFGGRCVRTPERCESPVCVAATARLAESGA